MIGPGRPVDTDRFFVICINSLGSCFGSTGPASADPATGHPYRIEFPLLTVEDIVAAARSACAALGIDHFHTVAGCSLGGMDVLAYAAMYPGTYRNLISISAAVHATPFAIGIRSLQRDMIRSDPAWAGGWYDETGGPTEGMRLARKLGVMSYRSGAEWLQRFGRGRLAETERAGAVPLGPEFEIEGYLEHNARRFIGTFDANCYMYLSHAMDLFDLADHGGGSLETAARRIDARRALVAGVTTDWLFPVAQQHEIGALLDGAGVDVSMHELESIQGHDAFLIDEARFAPMVDRFLQADPP
jgi:homoserine O-acetyltransferase